MKTTFSKEEIVKLLVEYYRRLEGRTVKVKISVKKDLVGFYESEECVTTFAIVEELDVAGIHKEVETVLSTDELKTNLGALFNLYEFDLVSLSLESGLTSTCEGFGMSEHVVKKPYFNGVTVEIKKSKNQTKAMYYR